MNYLDFEKPIAELTELRDKMVQTAEKSGVDVSASLQEIEEKIATKRKEIYGALTPWQRVQVSRHPDRPYSLDYIKSLTDGNFVEFHGDRTVKDDKAMIGGLGMFNGRSVMFIGQQKGRNTKLRQYHNFGMPNPEGYRKALRLMKMAEKFGKPVVTFIDTPGAYPGLEAEERGQGEAIARNLLEMARLKVPVICIIIGEGASGGALGIGIGDRVLMLENSWYSVISPENCSTILWRSWDHKARAAEAMKLTADDMLAQGLVDGVIREPVGGAHTNWDEMFAIMRTELQRLLDEVTPLNANERVAQRIDKFCKMGVVIEN
ncbi:MAG: acetyl-CoA carboxylase carboxyltransferase subunit alpha [Bacteroidia bacterium]|jgi:acetyl-CoA carboxylase carboxyl transferase subunit alpha|nr:acetyl-CoA carboxylase carboxyltransferase subunit alpha [Bacteroidia bacterium]